MKRTIFIAAIIAAGLGYLFALFMDSMAWRWVLKPGTIVLIILLAANINVDNKLYKYLVMSGLFVSAIGDSLLLMEGSNWFALGVVAFMIAHIFYSSAFITRGRFAARHFALLIPIVLYACLLLNGLHKGMMAKGDVSLWLPIVIYVTVISFMIWSAAISGCPKAIAGAILFFLSDSLLAWNLFVMPIQAANYAVMITYYTAQFLISQSIVSSIRSS